MTLRVDFFLILKIDLEKRKIKMWGRESSGGHFGGVFEITSAKLLVAVKKQ